MTEQRRTSEAARTRHEDLAAWDDRRLSETYGRLSRDLRRWGVDFGLVERMCAVEEEMRARGLDPERVVVRLSGECDGT